jgi:hypothetical protein
MTEHCCPTCGRPMSAYSANLRDETTDEAMWMGREPRRPGYYAEPCGHRVVVMEGAGGLHFVKDPTDRDEPEGVSG